VDVPVDVSLTEKTRIGVISPTDEDLPIYEFMTHYAQNDINKFCNESDIETQFEFILSSGQGHAGKALEKTQAFHEMGIDLLVGGGWSSQLWVMKSYVDKNKIIVVSPSSTNPQDEMLQNDYIFRLCTHDFMIGKIMAHVSACYGINKMLIIERGDGWGVGIGDWFEAEFTELEGETVGRIKYPAETEQTFQKYLDEAETILHTLSGGLPSEQVGVFLVGFNECATLLKEMTGYSLLSNVTWFSTDAVANTLYIIQESGFEAVHVKLISPLPLPVWSDKSLEVARAYSDRFGKVLDFYTANIYDACWVLALSVIEADSLDSGLVVEVLPGVSGSYNGLTGLCGLDVYGDRLIFRMGLYACGYDPSPRWMLIGYYNSPESNVMWDDFYID
jgi:branched-chain amino acid transport system substrate-binding protein